MQIVQKIKASILSFWADFRRIWSASKRSAILLIILEIFLGALVVIELSLLSHLIDATIGARGIGVWTSDMDDGLRNQVILFVILVVALHFKEQFKGLAAKVGSQIREIVFIVTMFLASFVASPFLLTAAVLAYLVVIQLDKRIWRVVYSLLVIAVGASGLSTILHLAVGFDITIGQLIWWGGSLMALCGWLALSPHLNKVESRG